MCDVCMMLLWNLCDECVQSDNINWGIWDTSYRLDRVDRIDRVDRVDGIDRIDRIE